MIRIERTTVHPEVKPVPPEALKKMEHLFGPTEPSTSQLTKDSFITGFAIGVISQTTTFIASVIAPLDVYPLIGGIVGCAIASGVLSSSRENGVALSPLDTTHKWLIMGLAAGAVTITLVALLVYNVYASSIAGTLAGVATISVSPIIPSIIAASVFI